MSFAITASIAGPVIGATIGAKAAKSAADTQAASADRATALQREMFDRQVELQTPWRRAGENALHEMLTRTGVGGNTSDANYGDFARPFSMQDFQADPGYGFRMAEGQKALDRAAAARGQFNSGRSMKDLARFSQGLASDEYGRAFDRFQGERTNRYNRLASLAGTGQTAANQTGAAAGSYGSNASDLITGAGNARAAGMVGSANAINSSIGQGWNMYQGNRMMDAYINRPGGGGSGYGSSSSFGPQLDSFYRGTGSSGD